MDLSENLSKILKIAITDQRQNYELLWSPQNLLWDYITYPFEAQELVERIRYWLEKKM